MAAISKFLDFTYAYSIVCKTMQLHMAAMAEDDQIRWSVIWRDNFVASISILMVNIQAAGYSSTCFALESCINKSRDYWDSVWPLFLTNQFPAPFTKALSWAPLMRIDLNSRPTNPT